MVSNSGNMEKSLSNKASILFRDRLILVSFAKALTSGTLENSLLLRSRSLVSGGKIRSSRDLKLIKKIFYDR